MKIFFLLAFLALVVSTAIAQYAEVPSPAAQAPTADGSGEWVAIAPSASGSENCEEEQPKLDSWVCRSLGSFLRLGGREVVRRSKTSVVSN
uniref:Grain softness protein n=1 Tax=Triticum timopheevii subsp. armeniacum TaxID=103802 RepID=B6RR29_TRITI|nr:grain softness protein [Triticum timopheevii subsp. armeniacum]ACA05730.1 grain softness protein [Triticum timopheevii subsp. armeniacum]